MRLLVSRHLENFLVAYETLNLHDAADLKGISQPALSKSLKLLEDEIGTALFIRTSRGLEPTPAGDTLHKYARRLDQEARFASIDLQQSVDNLYGRMRIGVGPALAATTFPNIIAQFHQRFPQISMTVEIGVSSALISALHRDQLDVVISALPEEPIPDSMISIPLFKCEMVPIARKEHPLAGTVLTYDQLSSLGRVGFVEDREFERNAIKALGQRADRFSPILQTTSLSVMFGMMAETNYYAIVNEMILPRAADGGLTQLKFEGDLWSITVGIVCKVSLSQSRAIIALQKMLSAGQT